MVGYDEGFGGLLGGFGEFFGSTDVLGDFFEFGWDFESYDDMRMDGWMVFNGLMSEAFEELFLAGYSTVLVY